LSLNTDNVYKTAMHSCLLTQIMHKKQQCMFSSLLQTGVAQNSVYCKLLSLSCTTTL